MCIYLSSLVVDLVAKGSVLDQLNFGLFCVIVLLFSICGILEIFKEVSFIHIIIVSYCTFYEDNKCS